MRDWKILTVDDGHGVDIDIINGEPAYLNYEEQTNDQRAALTCYAQKGCLPGDADYGVSWDSQYNADFTVTNLSNELQQQVATYAGAQQYALLAVPKGGSIGVVCMRGGM